MAGIGFELRRMLDQRSGLLSKVRAYTCAGLISSGPWLMTILTLTLLSLAGQLFGTSGDLSLFRALVTYSFAFSLILQGVGQMSITRWIADRLYSHKYDKILPAFAATLVVAGIVHAVIAAAYCIVAGFQPALTVVTVTLFTVIGMTWIALTWLSIAREYDEVLRAYIYGTLIAVVGMVFLVVRQGTLGIMGAYTIGQAYTLARLIGVIMRGMEAGGRRELKVFVSLKKFPRLMLLGLFYNTAIWIDKMVFWFMDGISPHPWVRYHPLYDTCSFLAYLTVVPALAVNLVRLETSFYEKYRAYYGAILSGTPLRVIERKRRDMFENLQESTVRLLRVQGAITIAVIIFAPILINLLELPPSAVRIFRLTALGAMFHVLLLLTLLMQLYFDLRPQALATSLVFLILNAGLAFWSVDHGVTTYGIGYALASFLSLLLGYTLLHRSLDKLDYITFTSQKIGDEPESAATTTEVTKETETEQGEEPENEEPQRIEIPMPQAEEEGEEEEEEAWEPVGAPQAAEESEEPETPEQPETPEEPELEPVPEPKPEPEPEPERVTVRMLEVPEESFAESDKTATELGDFLDEEIHTATEASLGLEIVEAVDEVAAEIAADLEARELVELTEQAAESDLMDDDPPTVAEDGSEPETSTDVGIKAPISDETTAE